MWGGETPRARGRTHPHTLAQTYTLITHARGGFCDARHQHADRSGTRFHKTSSIQARSEMRDGYTYGTLTLTWA